MVSSLCCPCCQEQRSDTVETCASNDEACALRNAERSDCIHRNGGRVERGEGKQHKWVTEKSRLLCPAIPPAWGCCLPVFPKPGEPCTIYIADDLDLERYGVTFYEVVRHEMAHCAGWPPDHPGYRTLQQALKDGGAVWIPPESKPLWALESVWPPFK
jgi:hypothetical protein